MRQTSRVLGAIAALTVSAPAFAGILELSDFSSDSTPASELSAVLDFSLSGNTLTLEVTNNSLFDIVSIAFNGDDAGLIGLTPSSANITGDEMTGWAFSDAGTGMDGFGTFDFALTTGINMGMSFLPPGGSEIFEFSVTGAATMGDFVSNKSTIPPGNQVAKAAAKFQSGPNGDSAFGACLGCDDTTTVIPLPSAAGMGLLGLGCLTLSRRRRD